MNPKTIVGLDVEASGMGLRTNFVLQIGLAEVDVETGRVLRKFQSFIAQPENTEWEERCVREFWSKHPERFEFVKNAIVNAPSRDEVATSVLSWLKDCDKDARFVVDTPGFDLAWLDSILGHTSHLYAFGNYRDVLDLSSWYLGLGSVAHPDESSKNALCKRLGLEKLPDLGTKHTHDAGDDAENMAVVAAFAFRSLRQG